MRYFFYGQVNLLLKRYELLSISIEQRFDALPARQQENREQYVNFLERQSTALASLLADVNLGEEAVLLHQIIRYRRCMRNLIFFEQGPASVLYHFSAKDQYFCALINRLCTQINYPCSPPLVCTQSNQSFYSQPHFNLIYSNVLEDEFLLASPDLVHELGHLFYYCYRPEAFFAPFLESLHQYYEQLKNVKRENLFSHHFHQLRSRLRDVPLAKAYNFSLLEKTWKKHYLEEFACDMFATYLVGPAFGWSHLRLLLGDKVGLYSPGINHPGTHPANEARMRGILLVLNRLNDHSALGRALSQQWNEYSQKMWRVMRKDRPDEGYTYCYNDQLLEQLAGIVISSCKDKGLVPYYDQPIGDRRNAASLMQMAWESLLNNPRGYVRWETNMVIFLKSDL